MIIAVHVATQTVMAESIQGFACCTNNTPVNENPSGLRIGGTKGAKSIITHNKHNCAIIIFCDIKLVFYIFQMINCITIKNIYAPYVCLNFT